MSRLIKFRGKHKLDGKWVVGNLVKMFGEWCIQDPTDENNVYVVDRKTVGQYTGINDKNGVEIYGGDIVNRKSGCLGGKDITGEVKMLEGCWVIDSGSDAVSLWTECDFNEVIGNIHENPELLEDK